MRYFAHRAMSSDPRPLPAPTGADRRPITADVSPLRLRSLALPVEHGGWGMLGEPMLLGLLVAPSWPGLGIALAAIFGFLARHPLKLALADRRQARRTLRTRVAERFSMLYAGLAVAGLALAARAPAGSRWWLPLVAASPLALVQLVHDVRHQGRQLLPEVLGGMALGSIAAAELLAGGFGAAVSAGAWIMVALKAVGAIVYVRARLRLDRGLPIERLSVLSAHTLAVAAALALAAAGVAPWLAAVGFALLLVRAAHGLSRFHRRVRPQVVGLTELGFGFVFILVLALGYRAGLGSP
jgi:YwiC-like protein